MPAFFNLPISEDFWNLGNLEVRKKLQDLIFPNGLRYSFTDGFGTAKINNSYQLIRKIALAGDQNPNMVARAGLSLRSSASKGT